MSINLNQIIAYAFYLIIMAIAGYAVKVWKVHSAKILAIKQQEEERAKQLLGTQTYEKGKQIVEGSVYEVEQLAKETVNEKWNSLDKHSKCIEFATKKLNELGIQLTDEDVYDIIKSTVGYINANKVQNTAPANISVPTTQPVQQNTVTQ